MPVLAVVPARLGSTRLPNKPLLALAGEPLVVRVARRVAGMGVAAAVVVATDADAVAGACRAAGLTAVLTDPGHVSGTDRVAEVAARAGYRAYDVILNVQGDEPLLPEEAVRGALGRVGGGDDIGTAAAPLAPALATDPARVKVVMDARGRALYFSRAPIPWGRDGAAPEPGGYWQHVGVYAFGRAALERWRTLAPTPLEEAERLEQLRALEHGMTIGVARLAAPAPPGIDTPEDLERAEALWATLNGDA
jgi:3-deoxy-manno-octulosonate cytidylyltransferase (CMP-KDO synthetase)